MSRWREERAHGHDNREAVVIAMRTAGHAVMTSGVTVAISLLALLVVPVPFLRSMGLGGLLIPLVSVAAVLSLLPAVLSSIGPRDGVRTAVAGGTRGATVLVDVLPRTETLDSDGAAVVEAVRTAVRNVAGGKVGITGAGAAVAFRQAPRGAFSHTHVAFVAIWDVSTSWATNCFGGELWSAGPPSL